MLTATQVQGDSWTKPGRVGFDLWPQERDNRAPGPAPGKTAPGFRRSIDRKHGGQPRVSAWNFKNIHKINRMILRPSIKACLLKPYGPRSMTSNLLNVNLLFTISDQH